MVDLHRTDYLPASFIFPLDPQCQNKTILLQHSNQNRLKSKQLFKIHQTWTDKNLHSETQPSEITLSTLQRKPHKTPQ